jgi:hypothetical protein
MHISILITGIYACCLIWGYFQERIATQSYNGEKFTYIAFLNLTSTVFATLIASLACLILGEHRKVKSWPPKRGFFAVALCNTLGSPIGCACGRVSARTYQCMNMYNLPIYLVQTRHFSLWSIHCWCSHPPASCCRSWQSEALAGAKHIAGAITCQLRL